jgi:hypothetical protein
VALETALAASFRLKANTGLEARAINVASATPREIFIATNPLTKKSGSSRYKHVFDLEKGSNVPRVRLVGRLLLICRSQLVGEDGVKVAIYQLAVPTHREQVRSCRA